MPERCPRLAAGVRRWGLPSLVAGCVLLQPIGTSANVPMLILAAAGLAQFIRHTRAAVTSAAWRKFLVPFACLWLPMALALPDAEVPARAWQTTLVFALFPFMALAIQRALSSEARQAALLGLISGALALWSLDGLMQAMRGANLLGHPPIDGQVTGVFHPRQVLGAVLAVLTPVFLLWLREVARRHPWLWLLAPIYASVILLSGKRSAWILLAAAVIAIGVLALARLPANKRWTTSLALSSAVVLGLGLLGFNPHFRAKIETTAGLFSGDPQRADAATSYRLGIWRVAADIYREHWVNGIGPRAFRHVYPDYAPAGDLFLQANPHSGPTHPHQILLEIGVETGLIGLVAYAALWVWLLRELVRAHRQRQDSALAWLLSVGLALFPLNAGHALYDASFWGGISLWLLSVAARQSVGPPGERP